MIQTIDFTAIEPAESPVEIKASARASKVDWSALDALISKCYLENKALPIPAQESWQDADYKQVVNQIKYRARRVNLVAHVTPHEGVLWFRFETRNGG